MDAQNSCEYPLLTYVCMCVYIYLIEFCKYASPRNRNCYKYYINSRCISLAQLFPKKTFFNYYRCDSCVLPNFIFKQMGNIFPTVVMKPPKLITGDSWIMFCLSAFYWDRAPFAGSDAGRAHFWHSQLYKSINGCFIMGTIGTDSSDSVMNVD